jgi:hypothetical protein
VLAIVLCLLNASPSEAPDAGAEARSFSIRRATGLSWNHHGAPKLMRLLAPGTRCTLLPTEPRAALNVRCGSSEGQVRLSVEELSATPGTAEDFLAEAKSEQLKPYLRLAAAEAAVALRPDAESRRVLAELVFGEQFAELDTVRRAAQASDAGQASPFTVTVPCKASVIATVSEANRLNGRGSIDTSRARLGERGADFVVLEPNEHGYVTDTFRTAGRLQRAGGDCTVAIELVSGTRVGTERLALLPGGETQQPDRCLPPPALDACSVHHDELRASNTCEAATQDCREEAGTDCGTCVAGCVSRCQECAQPINAKKDDCVSLRAACMTSCGRTRFQRNADCQVEERSCDPARALRWTKTCAKACAPVRKCFKPCLRSTDGPACEADCLSSVPPECAEDCRAAASASPEQR